MAKIIITVSEKIEQAGDKTMLGYEMTRGVDLEGAPLHDASLLPVLASVMPKFVMLTIYAYQADIGGTLRASGLANSLKTIESLIEDLKITIEAEDAFPEEIETEGEHSL